MSDFSWLRQPSLVDGGVDLDGLDHVIAVSLSTATTALSVAGCASPSHRDKPPSPRARTPAATPLPSLGALQQQLAAGAPPPSPRGIGSDSAAPTAPPGSADATSPHLPRLRRRVGHVGGHVATLVDVYSPHPAASHAPPAVFVDVSTLPPALRGALAGDLHGAALAGDELVPLEAVELRLARAAAARGGQDDARRGSVLSASAGTL
jgi:hypothetical protein